MILLRLARKVAPGLRHAIGALEYSQVRHGTSLAGKPSKIPPPLNPAASGSIPLHSPEIEQLRKPLPAEKNLIQVSEKLCSPGLHSEAAELDLHEAKALEYIVRTRNNPDITEETLYRLLTACYVARLSDSERKTLASTLPGEWKNGQLHLHILVDFARQELLSGKNHTFFDQAQDEEASPYIEELWTNFCNRRNLGVSQEEPERVEMAMDIIPPPPYRKLANGEFRWRCGVNNPKPFKPAPLLYSSGTEVVPKFFDLTAKLTSSNHFYHLPVDRLGWNMREFASEQASGNLGARVDRSYSELERVRATSHPYGVTPGEFESAPLLVKELQQLLEGIHSNELLRSLVTERPPLSVVPHHNALTICVEHARIWLARYDLRIYYDQNLTYAELGTQAVTEEEEEQVLVDAFLKERMPSAIEQSLRNNTRFLMCDVEGEVMHMRPEDYDRVVGAPETHLWRAMKSHLGHPVVAGKFQQQLRLLVRLPGCYSWLFIHETKSRKGLLSCC